MRHIRELATPAQRLELARAEIARAQAPLVKRPPAPPVPLAIGLFEKPEGMTKPERAYWDWLLLEQSRGEVLWFRFHGLTLLLGADCRYTPDFVVLPADGVLTIDEVKGEYIRSGEDGMVKLRSAATAFPFRARRAQLLEGGRWERITIPRA